MAALRIDPIAYLRSTDSMEVMALQSVAQGAAKFLNERDATLAKMIAQETVKLLSRATKRGGKR